MVGHPKPTVKWYRSGKEILADGTKIKAQEFKGGYYQLVIMAADETDATVYQVRATNPSGSISTTANLEVEGNNRTFEMHIGFLSCFYLLLLCFRNTKLFLSLHFLLQFLPRSTCPRNSREWELYMLFVVIKSP